MPAHHSSGFCEGTIISSPYPLPVLVCVFPLPESPSSFFTPLMAHPQVFSFLKHPSLDEMTLLHTHVTPTLKRTFVASSNYLFISLDSKPVKLGLFLFFFFVPVATILG